MSKKEANYQAVIGHIDRSKKRSEEFNDTELKTHFKATDETIKRLRKDEEILKLREYLKETRKKYESLGCGFHNGVFYFGTKLFKDGESFDCVVTSDKKLYLVRNEEVKVTKTLKDGRKKEETNFIQVDDIKNKFGLNYKNPFHDESLDHIFTNKAIDKWLFGKTDKITLEGVYNELVEYLKKYVYLGNDERKYMLLACYRIAGFFMPIWRARARLNILAEMGSGKSRLTQILHNTGFNSVSLGDWTLPYIKTIIESTKGETHIDDFETLSDELKNATERLIKVGYMRGFKSGKMSEGTNRKPEVSDLFNTATLNNTEGLSFISTDRCITIRMPKISNKAYDREPDFSEKFWSDIRDKLYILGLKIPYEVKEKYETINSEKIRGRLFSIIKPELTIAELIDKKLREDLEDWWEEEIEQRDITNYETDWIFLALKRIYEMNTEDFFELSRDVVEVIGKELYDEKEFKEKKRGIAVTLGRYFVKNPIFKKREIKGRTQYKVEYVELVELLKAKGFLKIIGEIGSTSSTNSIYSTSSTSSTNNNEPKPKLFKVNDNLELEEVEK